MAMIITGDRAPDFSLKDTEGNTVKLSDFKGKNIVLYFYPKDNTPGCTAEACSFRDNHNAYKNKGIVVLGVSMDDQKSHRKFAEKYKLPFTLLCDATGEVCRKYGAYGKKKFMGREYKGILRKTFLISKSGRIKQIINNVKCNTHAEDVLNLFENG